MATRMYELQQKVYSALSNSQELAAKVTGIFDYVPEKTVMPYITFGHINSTSDWTKDSEGETIKFTLDIWSTAKGRKESVEILTLVESILEADIKLDTADNILQQITQRDVLEEQYGLFHAFVDVQFQIWWEDN